MISPILLKCLYSVPTNAFIFTSIQSWFTTNKLLPSVRGMPHTIHVGVLIAYRSAGGSTSHWSICFLGATPESPQVESPWKQTMRQSLAECVCVQPLQSCLTLGDPLYRNQPGSSVRGILQARLLEWVAMPSSGRCSWPRDWTQASCVSCIAGRFFTHWAAWEAPGLAACICVGCSVMSDSLWSHGL